MRTTKALTTTGQATNRRAGPHRHTRPDTRLTRGSTHRIHSPRLRANLAAWRPIELMGASAGEVSMVAGVESIAVAAGRRRRRFAEDEGATGAHGGYPRL